MSYKVVIDSCGELTEEMKKDGHFETAPLTIYVDDFMIIDDETFDQQRVRIVRNPPVPLRKRIKMPSTAARITCTQSRYLPN